MAVMVKMDGQGRVLIPARIRRRLGTRLFVVEVKDDRIVLKPLKTIRLTELFDSIPLDSVEDFTDTHGLRRALAEGRPDAEVS